MSRGVTSCQYNEGSNLCYAGYDIPGSITKGVEPQYYAALCSKLKS